jgi:hypothetical protein
MSNLMHSIIANASNVAASLGMTEAQVVEHQEHSVTLRSKSVLYNDVVERMTQMFGEPTESGSALMIHTTQWRFPGTGVATLIGMPINRNVTIGGVRLILTKA